MEPMTVDQIVDAVRQLRDADRGRLVRQLVPEICRAAMDDPLAITMMLAECRRVCHQPEARRRTEFAMDIMGRMKRGA